jgi:hypothetical protein
VNLLKRSIVFFPVCTGRRFSLPCLLSWYCDCHGTKLGLKFRSAGKNNFYFPGPETIINRMFQAEFVGFIIIVT